MAKPANLVGQTFGRWSVIDFSHRVGYKRFWLCRCACGSEGRIAGSSLTTGNSRSCGCLRDEIASKNSRARGRPHPLERRIWNLMIARCSDPSREDYARYAGRGITVCDRWRESFDTFLSDMGERPSLRHSIDRIDNDGPYHPDNCRWALPKEQARNRRSTATLAYQGVELPLAEWAENVGLRYHTLYNRLFVHGWATERALTTPAE